jgi:hypothetical protein
VRFGTGTAGTDGGGRVAGGGPRNGQPRACRGGSEQAAAGDVPEGEAEQTAAGTACQGEQSNPQNTDAWFAAFAPAVHPRIVVGVLLVRDGAGGATAAPVARQVLESALQSG